MAIRSSRDSKKLAIKDFKLNAMLELTEAINKNDEVGELLRRYRHVLEENLGIEKLILYAVEADWLPILKFGIGDQAPETGSPEQFDDAGLNYSHTSNGKESIYIHIPVKNEDLPIANLLVGDAEEDRRGPSPVIKHMKFIQTITNIVLVAIRNKRLAEENVQQARIAKELELAAEMQSMLVPDKLPLDERYDVSAMYRPHLQVGGDYYDFIELGDDRVMFCMADVSGKGVSAAFLMANFQAYLMAMFKYMKLGLEDVVHMLNERVMSSAMGEKYITLFIATFDRSSRKLNYINCGHNPPVLLHPNGQSEQLSLGSIGLGMFEEIPRLQEGQLTLDSGSVVICYTDGLVEQENAREEEFGLDRMTDIARASLKEDSERINAEILKEFNEFRGDTPFIDDTALLTCRFL